MKNNPGYYVGVDSGGTKCDVLIASQDLKIISLLKFEGAHYSLLGAEIFSKKLAQFIAYSLKKNSLSNRDCIAICIGAAGAREAADRKSIAARVKSLTGIKTTATTDAMTAVAGAFSGKEGIILISGTGSVLYGFTNGRIIRVGGWGRVIGDEGSGFWIGKRALNLVSREYDELPNEKSRSILSKELKAAVGIDKANINSIIFKNDFQIQNIVPLALKCAEKGCKISLSIVDEAVDGLMWHVRTFMKISKRKRPIEMAFIGSVIENKNMLSDKLRKEISALKNIKIKVKDESPAFGAVLIASGRFKEVGIF